MNRSGERGEVLAKQDGGEVLAWGEWERALPVPDVIVSSVAAEEAIVRREIVEEAMEKRGNRALFFMDLGLPRNIDAGVGKLYNVYLYNVDDLTEIVAQNRHARENEIPKADSIVEEHAGKFLSWQASVELVGLINELRTRMREGRAQFIRARVESIRHLTERDRAEVE